MTYQAILTASVFLLLAFGVERLTRATGVPSVIVLIVVGLVGKPVLHALGLALKGIDVAVPVIGAIGLVLIVLEGALDIELRRERRRTAAAALLIAAAGIAVCVAAYAGAANLALGLTPFQSLLLAIPFAVISSAVAIPSSGFLPAKSREFVIYESSMSDILGVLLFFSLANSNGTVKAALLGLIGGGVLSLLLAVVCAVGLMLVLMRIDGHIRFIPLLAGLFGLYAAGKLLHLSPLILVLLFGLVLNNPILIIRLRPFRGWIDDSFDATLGSFRLLIRELTFAVRGFFFILLGYWTDLTDLAAIEAWLTAALVLAVAYGGRYLLLRIAGLRLSGPLTWIAPRGLITVLLFLSAKEMLPLPEWLGGAVMLVVLISATLIAVARLRWIAVAETEPAAASENSNSD
jgi:Kef-type K+ transport system membrane component KefB